MGIHSTRDCVRLDIIHSVYKSVTEYEKLPEGDLYPTKKDVLLKQIRVKKWLRKDGITSIEEYVTTKNTIAKSRCIVFDKYSGKFYAAFHSIEEVMFHLEGNPMKKPICFNNDINLYPAGSQVHKHTAGR